MSTSVNPTSLNRRQQLVQTYRMAKQSDPRLGLFVLIAFLIGAALGAAVFFLLPGGGIVQWIMVAVGALLIGLIVAMIVFGRRAQRAFYVQMKGRPGAAGAALQMLKRGWKVDQVVAVTKQQDVVHRVVGPPGIVLVAEGNPNRVRNLMATERRKHERVAAETPIHELVCGDGEGEVPLPKLVRRLTKMKRQLKPADMTDVLNRLKALDATRSNIPLPKGPLPTSMKGMRGNLRGR